MQNNSENRYHLCHLNIGAARAFITDPKMEGFLSRMDEFNNLAYQSPGFIWHLQIDFNNPEHLSLYGEPGILFNLSVWDSVASLYEYTYKSAHAEMIRRRKEWFDSMEGYHYVLWWLPATKLPTVAEGKERLKLLNSKGPTLDAFNFAQPFSPPEPL